MIKVNVSNLDFSIKGCAYYLENVHAERSISYVNWLEEQGGRIYISDDVTESNPLMIEFVNDEDYIAFKLRCM